MCGIAGILMPNAEKVDEELLKAMLELIAHRGPDGSGLHITGGIGLGHVRLAIQDLSDDAAQPMVSQNGRYVISYNGEVYNVSELRNDLSRKHVRLRSTGDTEALLEHISVFGLAATLAKVEGMFALALWDQSDRKLVLARDRHGIKPLYYRVGREVRFASEMKALLPQKPVPDASTLNATLLGAGGSWGDRTIFQDVRAVRPGEWLVIRSNGSVDHNSFFKLTDFVDRHLYEELDLLSDEDAIDRVTVALGGSVERRMLSDAPLACLVSGGVDSCIVAALAAQHAPGMKLYHANVLDSSEISAARYLAEKLHLDFRSVDVCDEDILSRLARATYHYEIPLIYHTSSVPFYMVSQLASGDGNKVVLTGVGSD
jgi:asparagine synthase (glutamine-hydrolysing)